MGLGRLHRGLATLGRVLSICICLFSMYESARLSCHIALTVHNVKGPVRPCKVFTLQVLLRFSRTCSYIFNALAREYIMILIINIKEALHHSNLSKIRSHPLSWLGYFSFPGQPQCQNVKITSNPLTVMYCLDPFINTKRRAEMHVSNVDSICRRCLSLAVIAVKFVFRPLMACLVPLLSYH